MKSLVTIAASVSAGAYNGTLPAGPLSLVPHQFDALPDGRLRHCIDGQVRAIVPPEGFRDYVRTWPDCAPVVRELQAAEASAGATVRPDKLSGAKPKKAGKGARRR